MTAHRKLTIREAYVEASLFLHKHNVSEASACAELLLQHLLGWTRSELLLRWNELFPVERSEEWGHLLERKAAGEPVQYIIGEQEFYGLVFEVKPTVLIPRPETELLVEQVIRLGKQLWPEASGSGGARDGVGSDQPVAGGIGAAGATNVPVIADIGAGSGAIAVSLAVHCPEWRLLSSDISRAALAVAAANAARHGVGPRVTFLEGDLLTPYIERGLRLDAVVSNPPYIPDADEEGLQPEVRLYEPRTALYGGADGLELYRRLVGQLSQLPAMPALVGLEVGIGQAHAVASMLRDIAEWDEIDIIPDLAGIERHVIAVTYTRTDESGT
ncbi:peptide chain release factor N(5)-glutamine methyltransferase [Paenibacillus xerothermodurans]|uniref:Release factor glutamine methyltransferase n=1 Tax=Paenibacillus xerothermodurans TaxID=1977292 RepID=A0A2W1NIR7_PAEXE|nr:peptide chain release factor N(5)-glutamine methyltransferase [Paenibacillus xerothermodurans]PZE19415.1 peptide chain release factor N(5)-glutamine methyltransferase [Paenibacillus xerothermodurans]